MFSLRKWFAAKMFAQQALINSNNNQRNNNMRRFFWPTFNSSNSNEVNFSNPNNTMFQFYYADEELNMIASELDSFDGRKEYVRCANLVNQLRSSQDKVISLLFRLMDECNCTRACRDYRMKFPDDLLTGSENGESLNGQIWFGAECLAAGSNIMNHEAESDTLRPLARILTTKLDQLRMELKHCCTDIDDNIFLFEERTMSDLIFKMEVFDRIFAHFEFEYVKAMLPIKSIEDIERQQDLLVLFSETVQRALKRKLISQEEFDECEPTVIINIPRLAIIHGLLRCGRESPIFKRNKEHLSSVFKPFHSTLHRIHGLLHALRSTEIDLLEKILINKETDLSGLSIPQSEEWNQIDENNAENHRRYSDPGVSDCRNDSELVQEKENLIDLNQKCSPAFSRIFSLNDCSKEDDLDDCSQKLNNDDSMSISSNATTITNSTVDSFEIALALCAKHSNYVSDGSKQLLHNLFVSIAGIADQLQSNYAAELRFILQNVYNLHCSNSDESNDSDSVEEAQEAQEAPETRDVLSSSPLNTPSAPTSSDSFTNSSSMIREMRREEENSSSLENVNNVDNNQASRLTENQLLMPPIWVPDELVSVCTACSLQFTLIRRRHHCRNCGRIYCNNCCNNFIPLTHYGFAKPVRVCNICLDH